MCISLNSTWRTGCQAPRIGHRQWLSLNFNLLGAPFLRLLASHRASEEARLEVVEFGESESKHIAALYVPQLETLLAVNLIYSQARLTIQTQATSFIGAPVALFIIGDTVAGF
jgi:hypothetical protein